MEISTEGKRLIEQCFVSIGGVKSFTSFGRLSTEQQECRQLLIDEKEAIYNSKSRELYLAELITCITGTEEEDTDEPISEASFSQYRFYRTYIHDLVYYPEKFDFLLRCVEESVCVVKLTSRFKTIIKRITEYNRVDPLPDGVVNYDRLLEEDEERRIESFTLRKDWECTVPNFLDVPDTRQQQRQAAVVPSQQQD